jgi:hypothetical protein
MTRRARRLLCSLIVLAALAGSADAEPPVLSFEERAVAVAGLSPDGDAVLVGVGHGVSGSMPYRESLAERVTADAAGAARLDLPRPLPMASVWVVVDLVSGEVALAAPAGNELREIPFPGRGLPASLRRLDDARPDLHVLWVRTQGGAEGAGGGEAAGAWTGRVHDGSARDGDERQDRRVSARLELLEPIGASPPTPEELAAGDLLVGIDTETLEVYTFRPRS